MNVQEFESNYREAIDSVGNQTQAIAVAIAQIEEHLQEIRQTLQNLNRVVENYVNQSGIDS